MSIQTYQAQEEMGLAIRTAIDDEVETGSIMLFKCSDGTFGYSRTDRDPFEEIVVGFVSEDSAIDHANQEAWEEMQEKAYEVSEGPEE